MNYHPSNPRKMAPRKNNEVCVDIIRLNRIRILDEEELEELYKWVDNIALSRPKKNMARDFSDCVLAAEVIKYFVPCLVDLHNFTPTSSNRIKANNWFHMNRKVFSRLNFEVSHDVIMAIANCKPNVIESVLSIIREKIDHYLAEQVRLKSRRQHFEQQNYLPEADQSSRGYQPSVQSQDSHRRMTNEYSVTDTPPYLMSPAAKQPSKRAPRGEMLPKELLDERQTVITAREETIKMLQEKIQRLEQLLRLKDIRIEELTERLDHLVSPTMQAPRGIPQQPRPPRQQRVAAHGGRY